MSITTEPAAVDNSGAAPLAVGDVLVLHIDRMAHGGEGVARLAAGGRVFFVSGAFPGDEVEAVVTHLKKSFGRAEVVRVLAPGPHRVDSFCPAAAQGAGCCDFDGLNPADELDLKVEIAREQLLRVGKLTHLPVLEKFSLPPHRGWRTRVRLGVAKDGRAGLRKRGSHELITAVECTQLVPGLVTGLMGPGVVRRFTPGAEVIVVLDAAGNRHVVETRRGQRGTRMEETTQVIEGSGTVIERADGYEYRFPATAFWQAHQHAPDQYAQIAREWLAGLAGDPAIPPVGWDLYGGVGLFVPALATALGAAAKVFSVDYSPAATAAQQASLAEFQVEVIADRVEKVSAHLPRPGVVILDPPRSGAGREVVSTVAAARPQRVIHVGCDPATFARDLGFWEAAGFSVERIGVVNAFPGTHHLEALALLRGDIGVDRGETGNLNV